MHYLSISSIYPRTDSSKQITDDEFGISNNNCPNYSSFFILIYLLEEYRCSSSYMQKKRTLTMIYGLACRYQAVLLSFLIVVPSC